MQKGGGLWSIWVWGGLGWVGKWGIGSAQGWHRDESLG